MFGRSDGMRMPRLVIVEAKKPISAHTAYSIVTPAHLRTERERRRGAGGAGGSEHARSSCRLIHSGATSVPARYPAK